MTASLEQLIAEHGPEKVAEALHKVHRRAIGLPDTRRGFTHKFGIGGFEIYLTVGLNDDGKPGEIFVKAAKEGSTLSGLLSSFCRAFSLALQNGLPLSEAVERFKDMRFEPMGMTSNPEIPHAESIVDYIARYLEKEFGK